MSMTLLVETKRTLGYESSDMDGCFEGEILVPHPVLVGVFIGTTSNQVTTIGEVVLNDDISVEDLIARLGEDVASEALGCIPYGARAGQVAERDEVGAVIIRTPFILHQITRYGSQCEHRWESPKRFEAICAELENRVEVERELVFGAFVTEEMIFFVERDEETDEVKKLKTTNDGSRMSSVAHSKALRAH